MSKDNVIEINPNKRFSKKAINSIINELIALRDSDPEKLDHFFITYGIKHKDTGSSAFKASYIDMNFAAVGFGRAVLDEISSHKLAEVGGIQFSEELPSLTDLLDDSDEDSDD